MLSERWLSPGRPCSRIRLGPISGPPLAKKPLPSCFSFEVSRDGNAITLINDCDEEYGVVPVIVVDTPRWPVTAVRPGGERTRTHPPWWSSYDGVVCCNYRDTRELFDPHEPRSGGRVSVAVNPCTRETHNQ